MKLEQVQEYEKAVVFLLNLDGWDLKWTGNEDKYKHYDASGYTPKTDKDGNRIRCVIEMKFRNKYYTEKLLEKSKLDYLIVTFYNIFNQILRTNLNGRKPSLLIFKLYKISHLFYLDKVRN